MKLSQPAYRERHYRGYYEYAGPRFYSERRYHRGPPQSSECIALTALFLSNS